LWALFGGPHQTDDAGVLRAQVPENKSYRIEIREQDDPLPPEVVPFLSGEPAVLFLPLRRRDRSRRCAGVPGSVRAEGR
jgi:hypothetical protein